MKRFKDLVEALDINKFLTIISTEQVFIKKPSNTRDCK